MKNKLYSIKTQGFTLLEILLVVAALGILAGIVILALNPSRQINQTQNSERSVDINTILNAVYQAKLDNEGLLPSGSSPTGITLVSASEPADCGSVSGDNICLYDDSECTDTKLDYIVANDYLVDIPADPDNESTDVTGYNIVELNGGRITVCAPDADEGETRQVTR